MKSTTVTMIIMLLVTFVRISDNCHNIVIVIIGTIMTQYRNMLTDCNPESHIVPESEISKLVAPWKLYGN